MKYVVDAVAACQRLFERGQPSNLIDQHYEERGILTRLIATMRKEVDFSWNKCQVHRNVLEEV